MQAAESYEDWRRYAIEPDQKSGAEDWKKSDKTNRYDYKTIRRRYDELVAIRESGDIDSLLYYLNEGLHGNMANMGAPSLYTRAQFGTKELVSNFVDELVQAVESVAELPPSKLKKSQKIAMLRRTSMCFGRSALMLSGAGSLGAFHLGVIKSLVEQDLLPRIISGASAGSFVTALLGTHTHEDLVEKLASDNLYQVMNFHTPETSRRRIDLYDLEELMRRVIPDLTFLEAYELSGLHINVSVAPSQVQQRSRLLNATTAPNALIREAVLASCAIPGLFPPVTLMGRNSSGKRQPYVPSRTWIDGSILDELPSKRLGRMYGANHFISSQANPLMFTPQPNREQSVFTAWNDMYQSSMRQWLRAMYPIVSRGVRDTYPFNVWTRNFFSQATQEYAADIMILPAARYLRRGAFYETLTPEETRSLTRAGEKATWPTIERIRVSTAVSRTIDRVARELGEDFISP